MSLSRINSSFERPQGHSLGSKDETPCEIPEKDVMHGQGLETVLTLTEGLKALTGLMGDIGKDMDRWVERLPKLEIKKCTVLNNGNIKTKIEYTIEGVSKEFYVILPAKDPSIEFLPDQKTAMNTPLNEPEGLLTTAWKITVKILQFIFFPLVDWADRRKLEYENILDETIHLFDTKRLYHITEKEMFALQKRRVEFEEKYLFPTPLRWPFWDSRVAYKKALAEGLILIKCNNYYFAQEKLEQADSLATNDSCRLKVLLGRLFIHQEELQRKLKKEPSFGIEEINEKIDQVQKRIWKLVSSSPEITHEFNNLHARVNAIYDECLEKYLNGYKNSDIIEEIDSHYYLAIKDFDETLMQIAFPELETKYRLLFMHKNLLGAIYAPKGLAYLEGDIANSYYKAKSACDFATQANLGEELIALTQTNLDQTSLIYHDMKKRYKQL